jgi:hypothetical protein
MVLPTTKIGKIELERFGSTSSKFFICILFFVQFTLGNELPSGAIVPKNGN